MRPRRKEVTMQLRNRWQALTEWFIDFSKLSSIHGVSYIGDGQRSWFERIFWIIGFGLSSFCCGKLIFDAWNIDPIIISFAGKPTPIWQIPFPAVTICPTVFAQAKHMTTISEDVLYYKTFELHQFSAHDKQILLALNSICPSISVAGFDENITCNDCMETLQRIRIPPEDLFVECRFLNQVINCTEVFRETFINTGLCYTFNGLENYRAETENKTEWETENWNVEEGYKAATPSDTYPRRALGASQKFSLSVVLKIAKRDFHLTCLTEPSFKINLHMPNEIAKFETSVFDPTCGDSLTFVVKPKILTISSELRKYPIKKRRCHLSDERPLRFYQQYTLNQCELNCKIELALENCGCLPNSLSKFRRDTNICGPNDYACTQNITYQIYQQYDFVLCNCLPACSLISYDSEVTMAEFNKSVFPEAQQKGYEYSKFTFYFKDNQILTSQRTELYGMTDFLASCGGILGLCLGVSVISLLEILYFCTIRLYFQIQSSEAANQAITIFAEELQYFRYKRKRAMRSVKELVADYSDRTTIQGVKYVSDSSLSVVERVWWVLVIVISVFCCQSFIADLYGRYNETPFIISFGNEEILINQIPFPAITVCPSSVSKSINLYYDHFLAHNNSLYANSWRFMEFLTAVAVVCDPELFGHLDPENRTNCDNCYANLEYLMGEMDSILEFCSQYWNDTCWTMFRPVMTERGVCYTFNAMELYRYSDVDSEEPTQIDEWTLDNGYVSALKNPRNPFPRPGTDTMLTLDLFTYNFMNDGICKGPIKGFQVYLHVPNEAPQISKHYYLVPFKHSVKITISPNMVKTGPELRAFPIEKRQCYYNDERYLRFFRYYTQNNCEDECLANLTVSKCGCQRFYMPEIPEIKYCGIGEIRCVEAVIRAGSHRLKNQDVTSDCNCLPSCTTISFDAEINQKSMRTTLDYVSKTQPSFYSQISIASLSVVFKSIEFIPLKRTQLYGPTEFLANCGALLGLFLGFSLMSILELFYFCTIRLFCKLKEQF